MEWKRLRELSAKTPLPEVWQDIRDYVRQTPGKSLIALLFAPPLVAMMVRATTPENSQAAVVKIFGRAPDPLYRWYFTFLVEVTLLYVIPVCFIKLALKERLADYGHQFKPVLRLWPLLVLFLAIMLPVTFVKSRDPSFRNFYPLYRGAYHGWDRFLIFEAGYLSLFIAQEFFFRGFLIEVLKPHMGKTAILVSAAIYGIGHLYKPLVEQLGAFFVGTILGYVGDRYRTFYFGVIVHYLISLAMDSYLVVPSLLHLRG